MYFILCVYIQSLIPLTRDKISGAQPKCGKASALCTGYMYTDTERDAAVSLILYCCSAFLLLVIMVFVMLYLYGLYEVQVVSTTIIRRD
jgi:hypothetical protein